jgi:hypothetical protein
MEIRLTITIPDEKVKSLAKELNRTTMTREELISWINIVVADSFDPPREEYEDLLRKATDADITAINDAVVSAHHGEDKMKPFSFPITNLRINGSVIEGRGEMRIHETEDTSIGWRGNVLMAPALRVYKGEFRPFDHAGRETLCEAYKSRKTLIASMSAVNCEVLITGMGPKEPGTESVEFKLQSVSEPK